MIGLDVKHAFELTNWDWIKATSVKVGVFGFLVRLNESYLSERVPCYQADERAHCEGRCSLLGPLN